MPVYEYLCPICHKKFELMLSFEQSERSKQPCPICGRVRRVEKVLSRPGSPILVGAGFHANDYSAPTK